MDALATLAGGLAVIVAVIIIVRHVRGVHTQCPSCGKLYALVYSDRKVTDRKRGYALVSRTDYVSGSSGHRGNVYRQEQALVERVTYLTHYKCKFCNKMAHRTTVEEYEPDFIPIDPPQSKRLQYEDDGGDDRWKDDTDYHYNEY